MNLSKLGHFIWPILLVSIIIIPGCIRDSQIETYPELSFTNDVQPIIAANCTQSGCHNSSDGGSFSLETYESVLGKVSPGNGRKSSIYRSITGRALEGGFMPQSPSQPLSEDQIRTIFVWIEQGALNN
ncbi:MAG: hypothetical protein IPP71_17165 [Bacteroidetes bacterium]|nr:hypothetical protein [Bacteroidota bacterium]